MIRVRHLVRKELLPSWVEREGIVKIIINNKKSNKLRDKSMCNIHAFYNIPSGGVEAIYTILGSCHKVIQDNDDVKILSNTDHAFLNGIQSLKGDGFISKSKMVRLIEIQDRYKINLTITKKIKDIIKNTTLYDTNR